MALPFKLTKSILSKMPAILNLRRSEGEKQVEHLSDGLPICQKRRKKVSLMWIICYLFRIFRGIKRECHAYSMEVCFNCNDYDT